MAGALHQFRFLTVKLSPRLLRGIFLSRVPELSRSAGSGDQSGVLILNESRKDKHDRCHWPSLTIIRASEIAGLADDRKKQPSLSAQISPADEIRNPTLLLIETILVSNAPYSVYYSVYRSEN